MILLDGNRVLTGRINMPLRGPWTADLKVDVDTTPSGKLTLECEDGISLTGTVDAARSGVVLDSAHVWLVGGAGGLGATLKGAWYSAQLRDPLQAILSASGESLSSTVDSGLLGTAVQRFALPTMTCAAALNALATYASRATGSAINWRILTDGTLWIGAETWPAVQVPETDSVAMVYPALSKTVVSVTVPTVVQATTVTGPNGEQTGRVPSVVHVIDGKKIQTWLFTDAAAASEGEQFSRNVRAALRLPPDPESYPRIDHLALYPARVDAQAADGSTVDVTPLNPAISPAQQVPLRVPIAGCTMTFATGAIVRLGWDEGDPSQPYAEPVFNSGATLSVLNIAGGGSTKKAARNGDSVDLGQFQCLGLGSSFTGIQWTPPGGGAPVTINTTPATLTGKVSSGSAKVLIGD